MSGRGRYISIHLIIDQRTEEHEPDEEEDGDVPLRGLVREEDDDHGQGLSQRGDQHQEEVGDDGVDRVHAAVDGPDRLADLGLELPLHPLLCVGGRVGRLVGPPAVWCGGGTGREKGGGDVSLPNGDCGS